MPDTPHAAVIGAGGFIGTRLVRRLTAEGRPPAEFTRSRPVTREGRRDVTLREARVMVYLAASVTSATAQQFSGRTSTDIEAFAGLLDALSRTGNRPTVVFTSSGMTYDAAVEPPYDETAPTCANTAYAATKLAMEKALFERCGCVHPVVVRLAAVYGPGHRTDLPHGVVAHWLTALSQGQPLHVLGDLGIRRDYVYV